LLTSTLNWGRSCHQGRFLMELEVESRNVEMTPRWKQEIEARMADLQRGHDDLTHGRVTLTKNPHHKKQANVAEALVVVSLPGRHTFTARKESKTFEEAIRKAFEAVAIELRKYREKRATKDTPRRAAQRKGEEKEREVGYADV
jgi:ribosomal subunit interface protein